MGWLPRFLRKDPGEAFRDRLLFGSHRRRRRSPAPSPSPARPRPLDCIDAGGGLGTADWLASGGVAVSPLDRRAAAEFLAASVGPVFTGLDTAPEHVRRALVILAGLVEGVTAVPGADAWADLAVARFVERIAGRHAHTGTMLAGALVEALPTGRVLMAPLSFLRKADRPAWFAMVALCGGPVHAEAWVVLSHHAEEVSIGRASQNPRVGPILTWIESGLAGGMPEANPAGRTS